MYQLFWGLMYFQSPIIDKLPKGELTEKEVKTLVNSYLERCKETRLSVRENEQGVFQLKNLDGIKFSILQNQKHIPTEISSKKRTQIISLKPSIFRGIMSYTGILGYYNPFTAEAQYNPNLPSTYLPFTLAHESAHQLGFAREQEANFIGFLIGKKSENLDLKYSTEYYVLKSLLNSLVEKEPNYVKTVLENYSAPMKRDRKAELDFRKKHAGLLDVLFGYTNDLFLKSNQQDGSITYSYFIDLLVRYERVDPQ